MPLHYSKNKAYTFLLPVIYGHSEAQKLTNNYRNIDNVYIDSNYTIYCTDTSNNVIYSHVFELKYREQYNLFLQGKYSKFSPCFKLLILKFWYADSMLKSVLFKGKLIKEYWLSLGYNTGIWSEDAEYFPKPVIKKEHINYLISNT